MSATAMPPEPAGDFDRRRPAVHDVPAPIEIPADAVEALVAAARAVDVVDDEIGLAVAVDVGRGDVAAVVLVPERARYGDRKRPNPPDGPVGIEVETHAVEALVAAAGVVDVEDDNVGLVQHSDVRHRDAAPLVLGSERAGDRARVAEAEGFEDVLDAVGDAERITAGTAGAIEADDLPLGVHNDRARVTRQAGVWR
jgi:hypothetical protein